MNVLLRLGLLAAVLMFAVTGARAADVSAGQEDMRRALRQLLRDEPDLILDVVREHSEIVLDIAQQGSNQRRLKLLTSQWKKELDEPRPIALGDRPVRGAQDAPVTIVAFSDFTCPYCTQAAETLNAILQNNPGKVRLVFKHFPLEGHRFSRLAAEYHVAASFQGADKAWALYDNLFNSSKALSEDGEPVLKKAAERAGLDMKQLAADLRSKSGQIQASIEEDIADGKSLGFQGTPNFLVNSLIIRGALSQDLFNQAVTMAHDHAMGRAKP